MSDSRDEDKVQMAPVAEALRNPNDRECFHITPEKSEIIYPKDVADYELELLNNVNRGEGAGSYDVGVAISGGGIRSATFALGIFQTFARKNFLRRISWLSTVSGGSYFGAFFGRLFSDKQNVDRVTEILSDDKSQEIEHLRQNGRYLAPGGKDDFWAAITYLWRNMFATQLLYLILLFTTVLVLGGTTFWMEKGITSTCASSSIDFVCVKASWWNNWLGIAAILTCWFTWLAVKYFAVSLSGAKDVSASIEKAKIKNHITDKQRQLFIAITIILLFSLFHYVAILFLSNGSVEKVWIGLVTAFSVGESALIAARKMIALVSDESQKKWRVPMVVIGNLAGIVVLTILLLLAFVLAYSFLGMLGLSLDEKLRGISNIPFWDSLFLAVSDILSVEQLGEINNRQIWYQLFSTLVLSAVVYLLWLGGRYFRLVNASGLHPLYFARLTRAWLRAAKISVATGDDSDLHDVRRPAEEDDVSLSNYFPVNHGGPIHFVNCTINETVPAQRNGEKIWRPDRKGVNLSVSGHLYSVGTRHHLLKRPFQTEKLENGKVNEVDGSKVWVSSIGPKLRIKLQKQVLIERGLFENRLAPESLPLGRWVALSGAAFSTGLGQMTAWWSSMLCALANVRLGYWWQTREADPKEDSVWPPMWRMLFDEFFGHFPGTRIGHWYITDGGHFENMGAYELLRRRVAKIIILDAECDPAYQLEGLGNLIRKARMDFGCEIEFLDTGDAHTALFGGMSPSNSALGNIDQLCGNQASATRPRAALARATFREAWPDFPTHISILYIKPVITGAEPLDIKHYHSQNNDFPQQTTLDQFFDEAQWESYRRLGVKTGDDLDAVLDKFFA